MQFSIYRGIDYTEKLFPALFSGFSSAISRLVPIIFLWKKYCLYFSVQWILGSDSR